MDVVRITTTRQRYAFVLLGSVQTTLIFTLAALSVPLPLIGREFHLQRADLILLRGNAVTLLVILAGW